MGLTARDQSVLIHSFVAQYSTNVVLYQAIITTLWLWQMENKWLYSVMCTVFPQGLRRTSCSLSSILCSGPLIWKSLHGLSYIWCKMKQVYKTRLKQLQISCVLWCIYVVLRNLGRSFFRVERSTNVCSSQNNSSETWVSIINMAEESRHLTYLSKISHLKMSYQQFYT